MSNLLIISCGSTDLQLVAQAEGTCRRRVRIKKEAMRAVHEALISGREHYEIDEEAAALPVARDYAVQLKEGGGLECVREGEGKAHGSAALCIPVRLMPAKLAGIASALNGAARPAAAIVFNTHRAYDTQEPVADGPILSKWLAEVFGLEWGGAAGVIGDGKAGWVNFLDGDMHLEGPDGESVNRDAVSRVDEALRSLGGDFKNICFALDGGIPVMREQIRAVARFRFPEAQFLEFHKPERELATLIEAAPHFQPADSLRARQQARQFVREGDFAGAYAAARFLEERKEEEKWIAPLKWAWRYFDGRLEMQRGLPDFLHRLIQPKMPRCLAAAMRTEAALLSSRLPEAIIWTCIFRDAALLDYIERLPFVASLDTEQKKLSCKEGQRPPQKLLQGDKNACLKLKHGEYIYYTGWTSDEVWLSVMNETMRPRPKGLTELVKKIGDPRKPNTPSSIRNNLAHSGLSVERAKAAKLVFEHAGLWAAGEGLSFLDQPVVKNALRPLGVADPAGLYRGLLNGLIELIEDFRLEN